MSSKPPGIDILAQNQRLFDMFKNKFSAAKTFAAVAKKFGPWLGNERAYYPQARTQIVQILLIAEETLRKVAIDQPTQYPALVGVYAPIVGTLATFQDKFVEPDLHALVVKLIANVAALQNPTPAFPTPLVIHTGISASQHMHPSSSSLALALTPTVPTPTSSASMPSPALPESNLASAPITPSVSANLPTNPPISTNTPASGSAPPPTATASKPKKKKKQKKKHDLNDVIQADLQRHRNRKPGVAQDPTPDTLKSSRDPSVAASVGMDISPMDSPSMSIKNESELEQKPEIKEEVQTSAVPSGSRKPRESVDMDISPPQSPVVHAVADDVIMGGDDAPSAPPAEELTPALNVEVDRVLRTLTHPAHLLVVSPDEPADLVIPEVADADGAEEAIPPEPSAPVETPVKPEPTDRPNPIVAPSLDRAALQSILRTMVTNANELIASQSGVNPSREISVQPEDVTRKTGIRKATVIARHRGLASGNITMDFLVDQDQLDSITRWNRRGKHPENLEESLCVTLLCFLSADVKARVEATESKAFSNLLPELECSWPETGGLSMCALWDGELVDLPLASPFALPLNGLVDVSPFLVLGNNTITINQTRDMTKYFILLCAHHPTPSQLDTVSRRKRRWTGWLDTFSQPLQLPFRIPVPG